MIVKVHSIFTLQATANVGPFIERVKGRGSWTARPPLPVLMYGKLSTGLFLSWLQLLEINSSVSLLPLARKLEKIHTMMITFRKEVLVCKAVIRNNPSGLASSAFMQNSPCLTASLPFSILTRITFFFFFLKLAEVALRWGVFSVSDFLRHARHPCYSTGIQVHSLILHLHFKEQKL